MKHFIKIISLAVLLLAANSVRADIGTVDFAISNTITNATTNTVSAVVGAGWIKVDKQADVGIMFSGQGAGATTSTITLLISRSLDGILAETTPQISFALSMNGTNVVNVYTNLTRDVFGAAGYVKCTSIAWPGSQNITNATLTLGLKTLKASP